MKRVTPLLILALVLLTGACAPKEAPITTLSQLEGGRTFAAATGTVADQFILKRFPDAKIEYYNSALDCAIAVKGGKADAAAYDLPIMKNICARQGGIHVLPEMIEDDRYGFAVRQGDTLLKNAIDRTLAAIRADGTYDDMMKRWFPEKGAPEPMPDLPLAGTNGVLHFGTAATTEPMAFHDGNRQIVGFDIELAARVAHTLGRTLEITDMEFGGMLPALISGKVDMIGAGLSITEERAKKILYSESYYPSGIAVVVRGDAAQATHKAPTAGGILSGEADLNEGKIGVLVGSYYDGYATRKFPKATILQYQSVSDQLTALNAGKVDAVYSDEASIAEVLKENPGLGVLTDEAFTIPIAAGFNSDNDALREQFNRFLAEIRGNGVYDDMVDRWMKKGLAELPDIPLTGSAGVLRAGVVNDLGMPFGIVKNGEITGFDIELSKRFAAYTNRSYEPVPLAFGSLIASISTNKIDIITASMFATEEREKMIDFSDPYYQSGASILARKDRIAVKTSGMRGPEDLDGKRIGVITGTVFDPFVRDQYPAAPLFRFDATTDMILALTTEKIDAVLLDLTTSRLLVQRDPNLGILSDNILNMPLAMGFPKSNPELRLEYNAFLKEIRADGTYQAIYDRWITNDANQAVMPVFPPVTGGKKLVIGTSVDDLPYVAFMNNDYAGIDIEILRTFGQRRGYDIGFVTMNFGSLIAALASGKVDMISDGIAISEERQKMIDFSDSYISFRTAVLALKKNIASLSSQAVEEEAPRGFLQKVADSFQSNMITEQRWKLILDGLWLTILISVFAAITGTIIGGGICWMRMSDSRLLSGIAAVYISLLRGTPVLVLLMIIYYIVFASVNINPAVVAVFAFGLNFGAYVSEMFRTSIASVDRGQWEAGTAGGFTKVQTFLHIITPQALVHLLPVYKGEFISLVKMTSIVGYIAVQDLTKASDIIRSRTFDAFFPLIMAAVIYLILAWLLTWALGAVEVSVDPKKKRLNKKPEATR